MLQFFYRNTHIATCNMRAICILRCNIDSLLLNQKGLVDEYMLIPICAQFHYYAYGDPICAKSSFLECLSIIYSHMGIRMGICTHFAHEKFAYGDPHMRKCLKKHISDFIFA